MKEFLRYILIICMSFAFLPIVIGSLRELGAPFIMIADFIEAYARIIWYITAFFGGSSGLMLLILKLKERKANLVVEKAADRDDFWDEASIKNSCRLAFYSMFDAISSGELQQIEMFVTPEFCSEITSMIAAPLVTQREIVNPIDITETKIVASKDCIENSMDEVTVFLKGDFVRPADGTGLLATTFEVKKMPFQILCAMKRQNNQWKLNEIDDQVNLLDLFRTSSKYEH